MEHIDTYSLFRFKFLAFSLYIAPSRLVLDSCRPVIKGAFTLVFKTALVSFDS